MAFFFFYPNRSSYAMKIFHLIFIRFLKTDEKFVKKNRIKTNRKTDGNFFYCFKIDDSKSDEKLVEKSIDITIKKNQQKN